MLFKNKIRENELIIGYQPLRQYVATAWLIAQRYDELLVTFCPAHRDAADKLINGWLRIANWKKCEECGSNRSRTIRLIIRSNN